VDLHLIAGGTLKRAEVHYRQRRDGEKEIEKNHTYHGGKIVQRWLMGRC